MICALAFTVGSAWAQPSPTTEVAKLLEQGKLSEAAQRAQNHLKQNANDVQMRFLQGVIATEQRKYDQAIQIFTALTQDYPGCLSRITTWRWCTRPRAKSAKLPKCSSRPFAPTPAMPPRMRIWATCYARMASDAYAKALQLDGSGKAMQPKLSLIKQIFPAAAPTRNREGHGGCFCSTCRGCTGGGPRRTGTDARRQARSRVHRARPHTGRIRPCGGDRSSAGGRCQTGTGRQACRACQGQRSGQTCRARQSQRNRPARQPATCRGSGRKSGAGMGQSVEQQNMAAYYAAYSNHFDPQGGTLAAWKAERKDRIVGKPAITVEVRDLKVSVHGERATANFRQYYAAGSYKATTRKTLRLQQERG